ncbi:hypothetical protein [Undibacterium terreum]|uniref:Uncharacterized protein n=1 Tax=Undibacterium terreum TaxID=1224302 RepID=A0A916U6K2_9BURK|nr:hypothetical protein [Undibacterium terreum]GGC61315.1 hypothetical protein GCM10011396_05350 [Undibacterium terreum]
MEDKMAGEIYIARKQHDTNDNHICLEEWLSACSTDPSLRVVSELSAVNPATGEAEQVASNGCAFYMHPVQGSLYVFEYVHGKIAARYDQQVLLKARELASRLGAILHDERGLEILA